MRLSPTAHSHHSVEQAPRTPSRVYEAHAIYPFKDKFNKVVRECLTYPCKHDHDPRLFGSGRCLDRSKGEPVELIKVEQ